MIRLTRIYFCALLVLLPLKFGNVIPNMEQTFFPLNVWEWLLTPWPPFLFPVLVAPILLVVGFTARHRHLAREPWMLVAGFGGLLIAALVGLIRTTEWDYAQLFIWHILGTLGLVSGALLQDAADPAFKKRALACIVAGTVLASISGWSEAYGDVNEQTLESLRQQAIPANPEFVAEMERRLESGRVTGPFANPNNFAAHLLLTIPLALALFWKLGGGISPANVSRPLFLCFVAVLSVWPLLLTRSRGGIGSAATGIVLSMLITGVKKREHVRRVLTVCVLVLLLASVSLAAVGRGRQLSSLGKRGDYLKAGVQMALHAPLTGVGVGEYFPWYIRLTPPEPGGEVTRTPHNVATLFFAQCGIIGGVAVAFWGGYCVLLPAVFIRRREKIRFVEAALFAGTLAWLWHSLLDFNFQIPGTVGTFAVMMALLIAGLAEKPAAENDRPSTDNRRRQILTTCLALVCFAGIWRWPGEKAYQEFYQALEAGEPWNICKQMGEEAREKLPLSPYPDMVMARQCINDKRLPQAIHYLQQAAERAPHRGSTWYLLARLRAYSGDQPGAGAAMTQARLWDRSLRDKL